MRDNWACNHIKHGRIQAGISKRKEMQDKTRMLGQVDYDLRINYTTLKY